MVAELGKHIDMVAELGIHFDTIEYFLKFRQGSGGGIQRRGPEWGPESGSRGGVQAPGAGHRGGALGGWIGRQSHPEIFEK